MRLLITGCAGFIGYHLVKKLLSVNSVSIMGIDSLSDYYSVGLKSERLGNLKHKNFTFKKLDINDLEKLNSTFDVVINLAAQPGARVSELAKKEYITTNIMGFKSLMDFCNKRKINKIIYASSSSVYSEVNKIPYSEDEIHYQPASLYGISKLTNEIMARHCSDVYNVRTLGLRFFSVYGPYGRPDMAYYKFTDLIKSNKAVTLNASGQNFRDMTYIDDIVDGIIKSIKYINGDNYCFKKNIFNLGNSEPIQTKQLLDLISARFKVVPKVRNISLDNETNITHACLKRSSTILKYSPKVKLEEGLKNFLDWHEIFR